MLISLLFSALVLLPMAASEAEQPPYIETPDRPQKVYRKENENDKKTPLKCQATGYPKPTYTWMWNGKPIPPTDKKIEFDTRTGTLSTMEEGDYVCQASNTVAGNVATSFSPTQTVIQMNIMAFKSDVVKDVIVNQYSYAKLECRDQGQYKGDKKGRIYKWFANVQSDQILAYIDDGKKGVKRFFIDDEGTLHIIYTLRKDQLIGEERYRCGLSGVDMSFFRLGSPTNLKVQDSEPVAVKPVVQYSSKNVQAILATNVQLECVFSGYDANTPDKLPDTIWRDSNNNLIESDGKKYELLNLNRILKVLDVQESDDQVFQCSGKNTAGASEPENVLLNVTSTPIWEKPLEGATIPEGRDYTFTCNARSLMGEDPPSPPEWFINGKPFVGRENSFKSDEGKSLTFTSVTKKRDIFCLQCIVTNSIGSTMGAACLNVILPINITLSCDKCKNKPQDECSCANWDISKGDSVEFRLSAVTDPDYTLTHEWTFDDVKYKLPDLPPLWKRDPISQLYYVNTSEISDSDFVDLGGHYNFRVFHAYEEKKLDFHIKVNYVTPAPVVSSASVDMWIIGLVIGLVFLLIIVIIIIFIMCRKQQEGVYNLGKKETGAGLDPAKELKDNAFHNLSRPDYDDYEYPDKKPKGELEYDDVPIENDDESFGEYGDEDDTHFNEDGSFIGNYSVKPTNNNLATESTI